MTLQVINKYVVAVELSAVYPKYVVGCDGSKDTSKAIKRRHIVG